MSNLTEQLQEYCAIDNPLFRRAEQREYAEDYVHGRLLALPRQSIEPIVFFLIEASGSPYLWRNTRDHSIACSKISF